VRRRSLRRQAKGGLTRFWNTLHPPLSTDLTEIFVDYEPVEPYLASGTIADGEFALQLVTPAGATLTVMMIDDSQYLCRHDSAASLATRSHREYYRLSAQSWTDLANTLLPLLALGWQLETATADRVTQERTDQTEHQRRQH
jgi:hypothetical protein